MSRARRKRIAKRKHKKDLALKKIAIADITTGTVINCIKAIEGGFADKTALIIEMGETAQKAIIAQSVEKYNKYGYFPRVGGIILGVGNERL